MVIFKWRFINSKKVNTVTAKSIDEAFEQIPTNKQTFYRYVRRFNKMFCWYAIPCKVKDGIAQDGFLIKRVK